MIFWPKIFFRKESHFLEVSQIDTFLFSFYFLFSFKKIIIHFFIHFVCSDDFGLNKTLAKKYLKSIHTSKLDFDDYIAKEFSLWEIKVHVEASKDNWQSKKIRF